MSEIKEIMERLHRLETAEAVSTERYSTIIKRLEKQDGHLTWLIRLVATGIIGAAVTFIVKGGFAGV